MNSIRFLLLHSLILSMTSWRSHFFLIATVSLLARCLFLGTGTAVSSESSTSATLVPPSSEASSSLIVCTVDGSIYTLDAFTGMAKGYFATGRPLVSASSPNVVPGLDGHIYYTSAEGDDEIQVLPMTMEQVLDHPVQTCDDSDPKNCGIVTGTKVTRLYAISPSTGRLEWTEEHGPLEHEQQSDDVVLLQRQDYIVRQISALTGEEVWNVTMGHVSALDFDDASPREMLPGRVVNDDETTPTEPHHMMMPRIAFGEDGLTVMAVEESSNQILWRRQLKTIIASVYGTVGSNGGWVSLTVMDHNKLSLSPQQQQDSATPLMLPDASSSPSAFDYNRPKQRDAYLERLWHEIAATSKRKAGPSSMVIYQPPQWEKQSQELSRLIYKTATTTPSSTTCTSESSRDGTCYDTTTLLLESDTITATMEEPTILQLSAQGLFLTYKTVVSGVVLTLLVLSIGLRFLYQQKKKQWMAEQRKTFLSMELLKKEMSPSPQAHSEHFRYPGSIAMRDLLVRSSSLPVFGNTPNDTLIHNSDILKNKSHHGKLELVRTSTAPTMTAAPDASTTQATSAEVSSAGNIDGIPLVTYSRYKSEFRELAPLGKGGFGTVFRCENALDGREYAIKKVWIPMGEEFTQRLRRVLREVKILALLDHPNIVRYYTAWLELEDDYYVVGGADHSAFKEEGSRSMTRCFSSELLTKTGLSTTSDGRRPSIGRKRSPSRRSLYQTSNPLGWNGIDLDAELDEESDDSGFHFDHGGHSSSFDDGHAPSLRLSAGVLPAIRDNSRDESFDESNGFLSAEGISQSSFSSLGGTPYPSNTPLTATRGDTMGKDAGRQQMDGKAAASPLKLKQTRHTLYIQMHLCSQKTLGDFLSNPEARQGTTDSLDVPLALGLFHQIAQGVKHVHEQGLIHRDLKPSNCFIDDAGVVKVGDFGLSRESGDMEDSNVAWLGGAVDGDNDNTAGVGTRSYASPEQLKGSDYGPSTDVYSLGIMLFELCYPMYTVSRRSFRCVS